MNEKVFKLKTFIFALFKELLCKQKKVKDQETLLCTNLILFNYFSDSGSGTRNFSYELEFGEAGFSLKIRKIRVSRRIMKRTKTLSKYIVLIEPIKI